MNKICDGLFWKAQISNSNRWDLYNFNYGYISSIIYIEGKYKVTIIDEMNNILHYDTFNDLESAMSDVANFY